ncbi:hypothetical protein [Streptomyces sp. NPDC002205]|uniref:hypothetical protein n=1 Tax=Streptomyces sp. NPDC002205 TaxID=3154411 RepID=UPI00331B9069
MTGSHGPQADACAGVSRLLVLCAVLLGLFLMHGAPANAAEGCHGSMGTTSPMAMSAGHMDLPSEHSGAHVDPVMTGMGGELCVSTPARDRLPLPSVGLLSAVGLVPMVVWGLLGARTGMRGPARRGPPFGGRGLLLQVCIART